MVTLWHISLLVCTALVAARFGFVAAGIVAAVGGGACVAAAGLGVHLARALAFLVAVASVIAAGLQMEIGVGLSITFGALFAIQTGALASSLGAARNGGSGPLMSTLAFYGAAGLAFLTLHGAKAGIVGWVEGLVVAAVALAAGLLAWRDWLQSKRFRPAAPATRGRWGRAVAGAALLMALLGGALWMPLPWAGDRLVELGDGAREFGAELLRKWDGVGEGDDDGEGAADVGGEGVDLDFGRRRELPERAELIQGGEALVHARIDKREDFEQFVSQRHYLRSWVLERYAGDGWDEPPSETTYIADSADGVLDGWVTLQPGEGIAHRIYLPDAGGAGLTAIQNPLRYRLSFVLESAPDMYEAELRGAVYYDVVSSPQRFADLDPSDVRPGVIGRGHLTERVGGRVSTLASNLFGSLGGGGERLEAVKRFLATNCRYTLRVENPDGLPPLENFLFGERAGWCDFFATAAVLLAREAGFPARMAYGFSGGQAFPGQQVVTYRESDAHAWAEVYVAGRGWVVFDATPPGEGAARRPSMGEGSLPALDAYRAAENEDLSAGERASRRSGIPDWAGMALAIVVALGVLWIAWRIFSRRDDRDDEGKGRDEPRIDTGLPPYLREFFRLCLEAGRPKPKGETLRETVEALGGVGLGGEVLEGVARYYYAVRYECADRDRGAESEFRRELKRMRKAL